MKPTPKPRTGHYYGMRIVNIIGKDGTWLEGEEFCYPHGGMTRRCRAQFPDGKLRVVKCGIPDTFYTIPARARVNGKRVSGYVMSGADGVFHFHPANQQT